ncbi:hypothetical protein SAMN05444000_103240 [Shimia gijangensis]|uniref:Uncharacterized protein n=1 Tax=Shimia gijangensis TaxID=1470563 RepID=A0A1M6ELS1_9RHOB|nr:hypothetical protein [Shimia gijangensis]SHI86472.1 hypothetical protein SAMN05444000_103240 [Shimia gijangensis]
MKTVKNLLLAMINATLILVAVCLFLFWQVSSTAERVAGNFAANLDVLEPVTKSVRGLTTEVATLRIELSAAQGQTQIAARIDALDAKLAQLQASMDKIVDTPDRLMITAIDAASDKATRTLIELRDCQKPEA